MSTAIARLDQDLSFNGLRVRMVGTTERPLFVAKDVCEVLGLTGTQNLWKIIPDEEKGTSTVGTPGGPQQMLVITEAGLYRLITRSNKPGAARFQSWVFNEVLPSIRKHGCYPPPTALVERPVTVLALARQMLDALEDQERRLSEVAGRVERIEARAEDGERFLASLPEPTVPAPQKTHRAMVNETVRAYGRSHGGCYKESYLRLCRELYYRKGFDAKARVRNGSYKDWLSAVESEGLMPELHAIAVEVFK